MRLDSTLVSGMDHSYSSTYSMHVFTLKTGTLKVQIIQEYVLYTDRDDQTLKGSTVAGCLTATGLGEKSMEF